MQTGMVMGMAMPRARVMQMPQVDVRTVRLMVMLMVIEHRMWMAMQTAMEMAMPMPKAMKLGGDMQLGMSLAIPRETGIRRRKAVADGCRQ